tara:strand:+ start:162 stop:647 length:486 start_codon:yes stop_codon:yes gene_type:complete
MQEIPIELENLIKEQFNKINEKINGLNFLETFKQSFIPSFSSLMETSNLIEKLQDNSNLIIEKNDKEFQVNLNVIENTNTKIDLEIEKNTLFVAVNGTIIFNIFDKNLSNKSNKINIYPLMGICLPSSTNINIKTLKNSYCLKFFLTDQNTDVEKKEKDTI